ncbi:hybrid nrps pks [Paramyrothecium foliicola]|nr:hybrid nrps pks [Paramyrothecium foliicola]
MPPSNKEPIAIIGSACRFPGGASSPSKLWELLENPKDVLSNFPKDRLVLSNFYNTDGNFHGSTDVQNKSYLLTEDISVFDPAFFHINALEAESMDPAQRILLETVYEAMDAAGSVNQIRGSQTSVFVGLMTADWWDLQGRDTEILPTYAATGTARSITANRISYFFDLKGASMTIDTACSSSLVALHQAVQNLRNGESETAIVAGANLLIDPVIYISESKLHMLSPDSRCRMWDKSGNGYARGEGCAAVLLKPLSKAIADGDHIETVIRETGVNSDGRTAGITMPSAQAQADLIRSTYQAAGLDPKVDRCQYFECHGTGTPAGDPIEAQAIAEAFFSTGPESAEKQEKMYVGSIKTVIGHLEGCSGLAGLLKASLAIQNCLVPANLHFNTLNPDIEPFYANLEVVQKTMPWPTMGDACRRASINSFGFGGTNSHVILESYDAKEIGQDSSETALFQGPLVLSAYSKSSLVATARDYAEYIKANPSVNLDNMAWILRKKRGTFDFKHPFSGSTHKALLHNMDEFVQSTPDIRTEFLYPDDPRSMLGIFTGQGAQWAAMGASLIHRAQVFRESIERSEAALAALPDPPSWSLKAELLAPTETSRLSEASISQPLCTALQIALVDLATASGVRFQAIVGHSSGEIAAAYAVNIISAAGAMAIAYYRGFHAKLARGHDGTKGGMLAVGISHDAATEFCALETWTGKITLAASNSPNSVTLSGDVDAIEAARSYFDSKKIFARKLQVDTAYHSHHMQPCAEAYLQSLMSCNIVITPPRSDSAWCSSVYGGKVIDEEDLEALAAQYWVDNMVNPVLFSEAVENSIWNGGPFEMAMELGPHPALKGPVTQVLRSVLESSSTYIGFLKRGEDAVETFSDALGQLWATLGEPHVDLDGYCKAFNPLATAPYIIKGLPAYAWDHSKKYWKEGRISRNYRLRAAPPHELLGRRVPDDTDHEMRWRNILRLDEIPWLRGHKFQGQVLFPAAAHVVNAFEASMYLSVTQPVRLIELQDVQIHHSILLEEGSAVVETSFTLRVLEHNQETDTIEAEFFGYTFPDEASSSARKTVSGRICVYLGDSEKPGLPVASSLAARMTPIEPTGFYSFMKTLGLDYQDHFHGIEHAERGEAYARTDFAWKGQNVDTKYLVHPVILDLAFQANLVPLVSPNSNSVGPVYLPTALSRIIIDPSYVKGSSRPGAMMTAESFITQRSSTSMTTDTHVLDPSGTSASMQIEGLHWKALLEATDNSDRLLFSRLHWDVDITSNIVKQHDDKVNLQNLDLICAMERLALFHFQNLLLSTSPEEIKTFAWHHQQLFSAIQAKLADVSGNKNPMIEHAWLGDSQEVIDNLCSNHVGRVEIELMVAISKSMASVVRGETQILEVMLANDMLNRFYMEGSFARRLNAQVARIALQIAHKHPRAKFLEIGAGTGGTTRSIFESIGSNCSSYTYTDISSGFFKTASEKFSDHLDKIVFKVLDIEKDIVAQGYQEKAYDVIVAANVLHATRNLSGTLGRVRSLLKPGGLLILMEVTGDSLAAMYTMGALPGWWLGVEDGRPYNPGVSVQEWDTLLKSTGFSGVDAVTYDFPELERHTFSVLVSRAVDEEAGVYPDALLSRISSQSQPLLLVGGKSPETVKLSQDIQSHLPQWHDVKTVDSIDDLDQDGTSIWPFVICLTELDAPFFSSDLSDSRLRKLQQLFSRAQKVLWLTSGSHGKSPVSNMVVGLGRSLPAELPQLTLQFLDTASPTRVSPSIVANIFLRLVTSELRKTATRSSLGQIEPEIKLQGEQVLIPRILPDTSMNNRFNARHRSVMQKVSKEATRIGITEDADEERLVLREVYSVDQWQGTIIDVRWSTTIRKDCTLVLGVIRGTSKLAFAVSGENASSICVSHSEFFHPRQHCITSSASLLLNVASHIMARRVSNLIPHGTVSLIFEPTPQLAMAIQFYTRAADKKVVFATSKTKDMPSDWITVHLHTTKRALRAILPSNIGCLIDIGKPLPDVLISSFPTGFAIHCAYEEADTPVGRALLESAFEDARLVPLDAEIGTTFNVQRLAGGKYSNRLYPNIVDWGQLEVTVTVKPLDAKRSLRPDRTYLLVGMTGDLGLSLAKWLVENGARYIVLTSRNADVDPNWLESMSQFNATFRVFNMDVTNRDSVHGVYKTIQTTLPPIAGVCNAAMVLDDKLFVDMSVESLNKVLAPKVEGSKILDELFGDTAELDFFVFFSSLASVFGNAGQSNYHAANMFMASLCAQRRSRGLAASVMHIGFITDVGYVARSGRQFKNHLSKLSLQFMSETDMHHLFAEAITNSRPQPEVAGQSWEIIAGIEPFVDGSDRIPPPFYNNPQFANFIRDEGSTNTENGSSRPSRGGFEGYQNLKQSLGDAKSEKETASIIQNAFSKDLEVMLQMAPDTIKPERLLTSLGLDSLIAVEIRQWFQKALNVDISVLQILKGNSVVDICTKIAKEFIGLRAQ